MCLLAEVPHYPLIFHHKASLFWCIYQGHKIRRYFVFFQRYKDATAPLYYTVHLLKSCSLCITETYSHTFCMFDNSGQSELKSRPLSWYTDNRQRSPIRASLWVHEDLLIACEVFFWRGKMSSTCVVAVERQLLWTLVPK